MKNCFFTIMLVAVCLSAHAQRYTPQQIDQINRAIVAEAGMIYKMEAAAWEANEALFDQGNLIAGHRPSGL